MQEIHLYNQGVDPRRIELPGVRLVIHFSAAAPPASAASGVGPPTNDQKAPEVIVSQPFSSGVLGVLPLSDMPASTWESVQNWATTAGTIHLDDLLTEVTPVDGDGVELVVSLSDDDADGKIMGSLLGDVGEFTPANVTLHVTRKHASNG